MCNSIFGVYNMLPIKSPLTTRHFPFSGRHLGFPVDDIPSLNSRTKFRKSHKHTPLYISRFQRYAGESDLGGGVILPTPWTSKGVLKKRCELQSFYNNINNNAEHLHTRNSFNVHTRWRQLRRLHCKYKVLKISRERILGFAKQA